MSLFLEAMITLADVIFVTQFFFYNSTPIYAIQLYVTAKKFFCPPVSWEKLKAISNNFNIGMIVSYNCCSIK